VRNIVVETESPLVDIATLSRWLARSRARCLRYIQQGYFPGAVRLGSKTYLKRAVLRKFLEDDTGTRGPTSCPDFEIDPSGENENER
jgi:hypothetical protein